LKSRQQRWERSIDEEVRKYNTITPEITETMQLLQDWLVAIANDQIACIDDAPREDADNFSSQLGYLTRFKEDFAKQQTPPSSKFLSTVAATEIEALRNGYVDLSAHCMSQFVSLIFTVDFRNILGDFFVPGKWYEQTSMSAITATFDDYMRDYTQFLNASLIDILVEEMSDALLSKYLIAIRTNKGVKFRRQDPFAQKFRSDVETAFEFFKKFPGIFRETIQPKWRVVHHTVRLLEVDKTGVVAEYQEFKQANWDLQLGWVEAVLKTRDEWDRSMITNVKRAAANAYAERGMETIMGRVK
jgi:exocyst complex component 3